MTVVKVCSTDDFPDSIVTSCAAILPEILVAGIARYKFFRDRKVRTIARLLLLECILETGHSPGLLHEYRLDRNNKPFITDWHHFNISHSGQLVALAYGDQAIGIDIEEIKPIETGLFQHYLHAAERAWIDDALPSNVLSRFYSVWSKKEAVLKADGIGILHDLQALNTLEHPVYLYGTAYQVLPLHLPETYAGFLATLERSTGDDSIDLQQVYRLDLVERLHKPSS